MHPNGSRRSTPRPGGGRGGTRAAAQRRHRRTANASEPEMLHRSHHPAGEDVGGTTIATGWSMGRARSWPPCAATRPPSIARPSSRPSPRSPTSSSPSTTPPTVGIGTAGSILPTPVRGGPRQRKGPPPTGTGADLREGLEARLTARVHRPANPVVVSSAGQEAGIIGAADLARQE